MHRIKKISQIFRILFQLLFILFPALLVLFWINAPESIANLTHGFIISFIPESIQIMHTLTPLTKLYGFLISLIPMSMKLLGLYFLIRLFQLYERGEIFSAENVKYIRNIGYTLLVSQIVNPLYQALLSGTLTAGNPPGHRMIVVGMNQDNLNIILIAFIVILISWIMGEACKLKEEQQYTV